MRQKHFSKLNALLGLILALAPFVLFPVCGPMPNGGFMMCRYSGILITGMGGAIVVLAILTPWVRGGIVVFFRILSAAAALLCYLIPARIVVVGNKAALGWECGLCKAADMACRATTMPAVNVLVGALVLVNVTALIFGLVEPKR